MYDLAIRQLKACLDNRRHHLQQCQIQVQEFERNAQSERESVEAIKAEIAELEHAILVLDVPDVDAAA